MDVTVAPWLGARSAAVSAALIFPGAGPAVLTGPTELELAVAVPAVLEALTTTRTLAPRSELASLSVLSVAPGTSAQPGVQRCHWYA